ncbi:MAG: alcohol dehydrogenase catalytic domain-containing protein [Clostridia bacterium]|jgi:threonine dehydrogenase-like Zn-dependent dehydrogenase|nr:alcohol dehydrogenase catalytic domain-containing protein [Clostridia bacterium]
MLAARYYGPGDIRVEEVDAPVCRPGQVLVRVAYAGVCGSDLHNYRKGMFMTYAPETMGHEFAGTVAEVGEGVTGFTPGQKVIGDPRVPCGKCAWCKEEKYNLCPKLGFIGEVKPGCFAPYLLMGPEQLLVIPPELPLQEAAVAEPLGVAVHIIKEAGLTALKPTDTVAVIGAGPIGLLSLMALKALSKASVIVADISAERLLLAEKLGANETYVNTDRIEDDSAAAAIEAVGLGVTLQEALRILEPRGRLAMAGLYEDKCILDPNPIVTKELRLYGINTYNKADLQEAVELIHQGKVNVKQIVTDIVPLIETERIFQDLDKKAKTCAKVLIAMPEE